MSQLHLFLNFSLILIFTGTPMRLAAQNLTTPEIRAYQLSEGEKLIFDGQVEEQFWSKVMPATDFKMQQPQEGADATEKTEVRIAYDLENLYLGVILYDSDPDQIKAFLKRRDQPMVSDERFTWMFDTFNDRRRGYFLEVNPNGMRTDGLLNIGQGGSLNLNWDGIWDARTVIGDFGWSAEIKIPFRSLNFDPESDTWGANFMRVIRRKNETVLWTGYQRNQGITRPQDAGKLRGLSGISQGLGLEVIPYGIAERTREETIKDTDVRLDAGFDINYSLTPGLKASLTINTDFAETEVDQRQVNLTRFPLFFPERRDFFLEGSNIYQFAPASGINPFFSRRIGLRNGRPIPITYGARILGNAGDYNLALLQVRTGERGEIKPENFTVARVKKNIGAESTLGLVYTRRSTEDGNELPEPLQDRHTLGADLELSTSKFLGDKNLQFQAFLVFHNSAFKEDDSTDIWDRSTRGIRLNFPNQPWSGHISYREFGIAYDPAVGFNRRSGFRRVNPRIGFVPQLTNSNLIQQIEWGIWFEYLTDMDLTLLTEETQFTLFNITFNSGDAWGMELVQNFERLQQPFDIKGDGSIIIPLDIYRNWWFSSVLETASYRKVSAEISYLSGGFWSGHQREFGVGITLRPFAGFSFSPEYVHTEIDLAEGSFETDLFRFEGNFDFTTSIFLSSIIQYDNLSDLLGMNNRLRWIITPGSDLFLVYNHNWLRLEDRFSTLQTSGALKLTYTHRF